jgi:hypothetical protein
MGLQDVTPRIALLSFIGWTVTILFIKGGVSLWRGEYGRGGLFLTIGVGTALIFFHGRKIVFAITCLAFVLVNVGLTALFHPSVWRVLVTAGSAAGLYLIAQGITRRYPKLTKDDWKTLFDHDPE